MPSPVERQYVRKVTLYSVLPIQAILSQLEAGFLARPTDRETLQRMWENASRAYRQTNPTRSFADPNDVRTLSGVDAQSAKAILERTKLYPPYETHATVLSSVRISKLITPQIAINASRAARRAATKPGMADGDLLRLMTEPAGTPEPITRQALGIGPNGGALLFTSFDEDIRLHHPPQFRNLPVNAGDSKSPSFENVCFPVGGGLPIAAAYKVTSGPGITRLILGNGIHRVYKLAADGYEWCPLILTDVAPMELPEQLVDLPKGLLLDPAENPPLITDFLDSSIAIELDFYQVLRTVRLNWSFEQYATVLK